MFYSFAQNRIQTVMHTTRALNTNNTLATNFSQTLGNKMDKYHAVDIACMVVYFCMMVPIIFGNGLILRTISLFENLHSSTHILIGSLATAGEY